MKINIFVTALALAIFAPFAGAEQVPPAEQEPVVEQKDYSPYPQPDAGYVSDHADLLTAEQEEKVERWLWQAESRKKLEVIVVTIRSIKDYPGTKNGSIEEFATALFNTYGIGNMPKNDGVLLLVAHQDRKVRIELGAFYGNSKDAEADRIIQKKILPHFRKEDYPAGITAGVKGILGEFGGLRVGFPWTLVWIFAGIVVASLVSVSLFRNGKRGWGWVTVGLIIVLLLAFIHVVVGIMRHLPKTHSSGWSSGGIGGFGGGFSGGGGATGSW